MKKIILIVLLSLAFCLQNLRAVSMQVVPNYEEIAQQSLPDQQKLAAQLTTVEALVLAQQAQVEEALKLTKKQRAAFEHIYKDYRKNLDQRIDKSLDGMNIMEMDNTRLLQYLKTKLANISAVAEVKQQYVDRFATVLTAEQIRSMYNTEGQTSRQIKQAATAKASAYYRNGIYISGNRRTKKLEGSGNLVSRNLGQVGNYSAFVVGYGIAITLSDTATAVTLTADDNVIDYVSMQEVGGQLSFKVNADNLSNLHISAVVPCSNNLSSIRASSASSVQCNTLIKGSVVELSASSGASIAASATASTHLKLRTSSAGSVSGQFATEDCTATLSSGGQINGNVRCSGKCSLSSSSRFRGDISAQNATIAASSGGAVYGALTVVDALTLSASSSGRITGPFTTKTCSLETSSGGLIKGDFKADCFNATASSSSKIVLSGSSKALSGKVGLSSGAVFMASDIQVADYQIDASSSSRADVYCTGKLITTVGSGGQVTYDGNCSIINNQPNVRHK
ncbi:MAG: DUF2807 domain-containing protein [Alistipes sp.]